MSASFIDRLRAVARAIKQDAPRPPLRLGLILTACLGVALTAAAAQQASDGGVAPAQTPPGATAEQAKMAPDEAASLRSRMRAHNGAKVLIELRSPAEPLASLPPQAARTSRDRARRRQAIARLQEQVLSQFPRRRLGVMKRFKHLPHLAVEVDEESLDALLAQPEVVAIQEDRRHLPSLDVSVPHIGASLVWEQGYTGQGQTIAILDTGIDKTQSFLAHKVISEACYSTTYAPHQATIICPSGVETPASQAPLLSDQGAAIPCTLAGCDHGTHVAGIAAGDGSLATPAVSFSGVAREAQLIAIQVFSIITDAAFCGSATPCIAAYDSDIIQGLERVLDLQQAFHNIAAVNMSLGGGNYTTLKGCDDSNRATKMAIDSLRAAGVVTVIAAGNSGLANALAAPGCISTALSVGATSDLDQVASFSNSASWLAVFAPGVGIRSSVLGNSFGNKSGTSMAAPHVAGAIALLSAKAAAEGIVPSADQLIATLTTSGFPITDPDNGAIIPLIQVQAAADSLVADAPLAVDLVLDSALVGTVVRGSFTSLTTSTAYGGQALLSSSTVGNTFRFTPNLPQPGAYRIEAWWTAAPGSSDRVAFDISHDAPDGNGTVISTVEVNQQVNGGRWYELGVFSLRPDGSAFVEISNRHGAIAVADAIRFRLDPSLGVANLLIDSLSSPPAAATPGSSFQVTETVSNQGTLTASASTTRYYLSPDPVKSSTDTLLTGTRAVPSLAPGAASTGTASVTIPTSTLQGTYFVLACADATNTVVESNENNNCRATTGTVQVGSPDLLVTSLTEAPPTATLGSSFVVAETIHNQGTGIAGASTVRYYLSLDSLKSSTDRLVSGSHSVAAGLAPGASLPGSATVTIPRTTPLGTYFLLACADATNTVLESNETNNCRATAGTVQIGAPDLLVSALTEPPAMAVLGGSFVVTEIIHNQGTATAGAFTVRYYLSLDSLKSSTDRLVSGSHSVAAGLAPGAALPGSATVTIPSTTPLGTYFLLACADATNTVLESNETNNCRATTGTVQVGSPDLLVSALTEPPATAFRGSRFVVTDTIHNQGTTAAGTSSVRYYLSLDSLKSSTDRLVSGSHSVAAGLAPGASLPGSATVTIPSTTPLGTYFLLACADATNTVLESNETNNCRATVGTVELR
ncbi:MAG: CARDB domain-containing protein [Candidatus Tectimicrobiota bacterium]